MHRNKNSVVILQDKMVFWMGIILFIWFTVCGVVFIYLTFTPYGVGTSADRWIVRAIFSACVLLFPILFIVDPYRYLVWYRFTSEGIYYHTTFRRKKLLPYGDFPYIMHGRYLHISYWRDYIVFSSRWLSNTELESINHVAPSTKLLKVKYSEKTCQTLLEILPRKQRASVAGVKAAIERR